MHPRDVLVALHTRDPLLSTLGWVLIVGFFVCLGLMLFDSRLITGINAWIKPAKFSISVAIYVWTIGWLLADLAGATRTVSVIRWTVFLTMVVEMVCIYLQAARGTTSHYNISTPLDGAIFSAMGIAILLNTLVAVALLVLYATKPGADLSPLYRWAVVAGIAVFLFGSYAGQQMISNMGHTIGAPDGGQGLPFLNWSVTAGDLRIAHFFGLHALQLFPLTAWLLSRATWSPSITTVAFVAVTLVYTGFVALTYLQAWAGQPLIAG